MARIRIVRITRVTSPIRTAMLALQVILSLSLRYSMRRELYFYSMKFPKIVANFDTKATGTPAHSTTRLIGQPTALSLSYGRLETRQAMESMGIMFLGGRAMPCSVRWTKIATAICLRTRSTATHYRLSHWPTLTSARPPGRLTRTWTAGSLPSQATCLLCSRRA